MRKWFFIGMLLVMGVFSVQAQYIVVPQKLASFKHDNPYGLSDLMVNYFKSKGFEVVIEDSVLPDDLAKDKCKALYANLVENSGMFTTKLAVEIKNCKNEIVAISKEGTSREKDLRTSHNLAFRTAANTLEITKLKNVFSSNENASSNKLSETPQEVLPVTSAASSINVALFAQPIEGGFQLVDTTVPKNVMKIYQTSVVDYFIAQKDDKSGVVFKRNNTWFFEYLTNGKVVSESVQIRF